MEILSTTLQTPIEIALKVDDQGMTTARALYDYLNLADGQFSRWAKSNITENEFATENEDFWGFDIDVEGNIIKDYKLTAHFAKKLSMKGNGAKAEAAREYFTRIEEKAKKDIIDRSKLSKEMQLLYTMIDSQAKQELEQQRQAEQINAIDTKVSNMQEIFTEPLGDWKNDINHRVRQIAQKANMEYQEVYNRMYGELENTAHCSLKKLQDNKTARMEKAGNTKSAIKDGTSKIAIVYEKPTLKAIFEGIVRRWAMSYLA